jgi:tellurite resistance protein TerC
MKLFHYLNYGLSVVLMFIGAKMLLPEKYHVPTWAALAVVAGVLTIAVLASVLFPQKEGPDPKEQGSGPDAA